MSRVTPAMMKWMQETELPVPAEHYVVSAGADGCVLTPMTNTSLQPTCDFHRALSRLGGQTLSDVASVNVSNLVMHGATYSDACVANIQKSAMVVGNAPASLEIAGSAVSTLLSSDFPTGQPVHTRLTIKRSRLGGPGTVAICPRQQVMSFNNVDQRPPHQVRRLSPPPLWPPPGSYWETRAVPLCLPAPSLGMAK